MIQPANRNNTRKSPLFVLLPAGCFNRSLGEPFCVLNDAVCHLCGIALTFLLWLDHAASMTNHPPIAKDISK
jgi:hypothetical protein